MSAWGIPPTTPVLRFFLKGIPIEVPKAVQESEAAFWEYIKKASRFRFSEVTTSKQANQIIKENQFSVFSFWDKLEGNMAPILLSFPG